MIPIQRGTEPDVLRRTRNDKLPALSLLVKQRPLRSDDIDGYRCVALDLWRAQHHKCCYCEDQIRQKFHDVEHYRPKASADRSPGCVTRHGYWWLAFHWSNLLFACPACNRTGKNDQFPLEVGSTTLAARKTPPGGERPLLLDPSQDNGTEHIEYVFIRLSIGGRKQWLPRPRLGSLRGDWTIRVLQLDCMELIECYSKHVNDNVRPDAEALLSTLQGRDSALVRAAFDRAARLLHPGLPFVGLSYDALRTLVPTALLLPFNLRWPEPEAVGRILAPPSRRTKPPARDR